MVSVCFLIALLTASYPLATAFLGVHPLSHIDTISQVIRGEVPITPELAVKFTSAISGPDSAMWLRMQATYDDWQRKHHNPQEL